MESRVCSNCGTVVLPGDKFCLRCGKPVKMTASGDPVSQPAKNQLFSQEYIANDAPFSTQAGSWDTGVKVNHDTKDSTGQAYISNTAQSFVQPPQAQQTSAYPEQLSAYPQQPVYPQPSVFTEQPPAYTDQPPAYPQQPSAYPEQTQPAYQNQPPFRSENPAVSSALSDPEPAGRFVSFEELETPGGIRAYLTKDQDLWNRWMQSNIEWLSNHSNAGADAKPAKKKRSFFR